MKKSIAMQWVKALRSGKYKQGVGSLRDIDSNFCCLGVLCDISKKGKWVDNSAVIVGYTYDTGNDTEQAVLPEEIKNWAEMDSTSGKYENNKGQVYSLTDWNDGEEHSPKQTFEQIANFIEKYWRVL